MGKTPVTDIMLQVNLSTLAATLIGAAIIAAGGLAWRTMRAVDKLVEAIGDTKTPLTVLARLWVLENEFRQIRDWAILNGYERRHNNEEAHDSSSS